MSNPDLIQKAWEGFADMTLPKEASENQRRDMRNAFFAGSISLMSMMIGLLEDAGNPDEVTEMDMQVMEWIRQEFVQFKKDMESGNA